MMEGGVPPAARIFCGIGNVVFVLLAHGWDEANCAV